MSLGIKQLIINGKKSYDDFGVYIASRTITSPKKKTIKETVPFSNTTYDFSKINGEIYWEERTLKYSFDIAEITTEQMEVVKGKLQDWLLNVHDTDIYDPYIEGYHFHGSYDSDSWSEDFGAGTISVTFSVYPYKISNTDSSVIEEIGVSEDGTLENSVAGNVGRLIIKGNSIQKTRSGKNKWNNDLVATTGIIEKLDTGFKITRSDTSRFGEIYPISLPIGNYGLYGNMETNAVAKGSGFVLHYSDGTSGTRPFSFVNGDDYMVIDKDVIKIQPYIDSNEPVGTYYSISDFMILEATETDLTYEPYGASPSPEFPSEIKSLGDDKNLWSLGNQTNLSGDINLPLDSGDYVLSFVKKRISNSTITNTQLYRYVYLKFYDENDTLLSTINDGGTIKLTDGQTSDRQYIKFTAPENTKKCIVNFGNNNGDNNRNTDVIDIKLHKGTTATPFSYYGYGGLEVISTGKNLLNIYDIEENGADTYEVLSNDWIHYANTSGNAKRVFFKKFKVKPNTTYYLNYELEEGKGEDITFLYQYDENGNSIMMHYPSSSIFITTLENTKYAKIGVTTQSQSAIDDYKIRLMLVESSVKDNVYEAYKGNKVTINTSEVCSIKDIEEELIINDNSAKIKKKFEKLILTGNEANYSLVVSNSNENFIQMNLFLNPANVDSRNAGSYVMSTHFVYSENASTPNKTNAGFRSYDKNVLVFSIPTEIATDVATWKQYLKDLYRAGKPVIVYYLLNEYYEVELEDVSSISTYKGSTTINIDSNLETTFEVGYYEPPKKITINNNSSHRIMPKITSTGSFTITLNNTSYSIGEGTYTNTFYLETGENKLTLNGYGEITFSYVEEVF